MFDIFDLIDPHCEDFVVGLGNPTQPKRTVGSFRHDKRGVGVYTLKKKQEKKCF